MGWKQWPSWLKGGLIAESILIIYILLGIALVMSPPNIQLYFPEKCIGYEAFPAPTIIPLWCTLFFSSYYTFLSWFLIGALIGWIVGKIKARRQSTSP